MLWGPTSLWTWDFSQGWRKMLNLLYFQQPHPGFKRPYKKYQTAGPLRITALWCGPIYRVLVYWGFTSTNGLSLQWPTYWHPIVAMELQFWSTPTVVHLLLKSPQVWNWKHVFFFCYVESNLKNDCGKHWHRNWGILVFKMLVGESREHITYPCWLAGKGNTQRMSRKMMVSRMKLKMILCWKSRRMKVMMMMQSLLQMRWTRKKLTSVTHVTVWRIFAGFVLQTCFVLTSLAGCFATLGCLIFEGSDFTWSLAALDSLNLEEGSLPQRAQPDCSEHHLGVWQSCLALS